MLFRLTTVAVALASVCSADTLTLRSGRVVRGQYLGGDARHIRMAVGDRVDTFDVADVGDLEFSGDARQNDAPGGFAQAPPPATAPASGVQIPTGTPITVRMIDTVDSNVARLGQTFRSSVDEPVMINGQTVIPRGADALVKLVEVGQSGKFEAKTVLTLALTDITINGQTIDTTTSDVSQASSSRRARTAKVVGRATALGVKIPSETRLNFTLQQPIQF